MAKNFQSVRPMDNFYQSSSFFPMPLCLIGTLDEKGENTSFGAYSLIFPYYIAGKDHYAMVLEARNSSNTAKGLIRHGKCTINFLPYKKKYFEQHVKCGFPGDTPEEKMKDFMFNLEDSMSQEEDPKNKYPKIISEAYQVFECTWWDELDNAKGTKVEEEYNGPYHNFNGITSKFGAHFILKIDKILMQPKYYDAMIHGVTRKNFMPLPTNWGYRDSRYFWCSGFTKPDPVGIPDRAVDVSSVKYAVDRLNDKSVTFSDDALEMLVKIPRPFMKAAIQGIVDKAHENGWDRITPVEMKIINDKRSKEKGTSK